MSRQGNIFKTPLVLIIIIILIGVPIKSPAKMAFADPTRVRNPENGHWYQQFHGLSWHTAKDYCTSLGAHLATIESASENSFVYNVGWGWLGGTDEAAEGDWRWITGEPWSYTNWAEGEPNNCAHYPPCEPENHLIFVQGSDQWNDAPGSTGSFICEWEYDCSYDPLIEGESHGTDIPSTGMIRRDSRDFSRLRYFDDPDVHFKDEEGTGADHMMQKSLVAPLRTLIDLVNTEWNNEFQLRITEAWDEDGEHSRNSSHYEGRGLDLTVWDPRTGSLKLDLYPCLGGLAVQAGSSYALNEGNHIHVTHEGWHTSPDVGASFSVYSPVSLTVTDPDGLRVSEDLNEIPGAIYTGIDVDADDESDDRVVITVRKTGNYLITVTPKPNALLTDTYTIEVIAGNKAVFEVKDIQVRDIPSESYVAYIHSPYYIYIPFIFKSSSP